MSGAVRTEWIDDPARLFALAPEWERLARRELSPFTGPSWFRPWWDAFGRRLRLETCAAWRGDELVGLFPLQRAGQRLEALANDETPLFRPLAADAEALAALVGEVERSDASELRVPMLPVDDPSFALLRSGRRPRVVLEDERLSPLVEIAGTFDDYRARTRPRWRSPIEKRRRKTLREGGELELLESPHDLDAVLTAGLELEASGWKARAGTAILARPDTAAFFRGLAREFDARGDLRLSWTSYGGRPIAFDFSILHGGRLWSLKGAYDESASGLAPGLVLRLSIIERCFELGIEAYELLGVSEEWKAKFATSARRLAELRSYGSTPLGLVGYGYRRVVRPRLRSAYRGIRAREPQSPEAWS